MGLFLLFLAHQGVDAIFSIGSCVVNSRRMPSLEHISLNSSLDVHYFPFCIVSSSNQTMKIAVYSRGGSNVSRHTQRWGSRDFSGSRTRYTNQEKLNILSLVQKTKLEEGLNAAQAASSLQIDPSLLSRWAQKKDTIQGSSGSKLTASPGHTGLLTDVQAELLAFVEEWRQKGFDVNRFTLLRKAGTLKPEILNKSEGAAKICLSWFLAKNNLTHSVATHMAHRDPREVVAEAVELLEYVRPHLEDGSPDPDYIMNMDQTPVTHAMNARTTIERKGTRTVNMRTSAGDTKHVTVAATITASGKILPTMVVFKGESLQYD